MVSVRHLHLLRICIGNVRPYVEHYSPLGSPHGNLRKGADYLIHFDDIRQKLVQLETTHWKSVDWEEGREDLEAGDVEGEQITLPPSLGSKKTRSHKRN